MPHAAPKRVEPTNASCRPINSEFLFQVFDFVGLGPPFSLHKYSVGGATSHQRRVHVQARLTTTLRDTRHRFVSFEVDLRVNVLEPFTRLSSRTSLRHFLTGN